MSDQTEDETIPLVHNPMLGYPRNAPCPCGDGKKYKKCHGPVMPRLIPETQLEMHQDWVREGKAWASHR